MANKKVFTDESLSTLVDNIKSGDEKTLSSAKEYSDSIKTDLVDGDITVSHATTADTASAVAWSDVTGKPSTFSPASHNHDDRYYTETEIDTKLAGKSDTSHNHNSAYDTKGAAAAVQTNLDTVSDTLDSHIEDSGIHVTTTNKSNWNTAYTHSQAAHARTDATKVADSTTNGNILINGTETNVYSHPNSGVTAGTYKSVTVNAQGHITGGTNPTTLAGYGITDAESKGSASAALTSAKEYTDTVAAGKADTDHNHDSAYDTKGAASSALSSAKSYADSAATTAANQVKNDLLNGAGTAYDTLKELGDLIVDNADAIEALETIASGKADASHSHAIADVSGLQSALDGKAASSHGTHVSYSTTAPVMDGTASVGTASTVARSDHKHPTDTSRAAQTDLDSHTGNTTVHITSTERTNWNAAKTHADSTHAPSNAEKNQNAFSNITVGSTTVAADSATDTVTFVGSNVTITPDATNDKITFAVADGSTSAKGLVQLTNSTSSSSTTTAATPSSVKSAYDLANTAKTNAATAQSKADSAYSLAESKVDSLSDLGITATAAELNYVDGVTSNIQTQLDGKAASSHNHAASNITSGTLSSDRLPTVPVAKGGTGATTAANALINLGLTATAAELNKMDGVTATTTELNYVDGVTSNIQTQLNGKAASSHSHAASDITSGTIAAARLPAASGTQAGITIVYPAASCTTFSSDTGTVTPLAVQKGAKMFAIPRTTSTEHAVTRFTDTEGAVENSKIIIEDVTNTRDTSKTANVLAIPAEGGKKMVYGYCTDQIDGTSFIGGVFDADATEYPYSAGLAIGGTSGNLLWKGERVTTTTDLNAKQATITGGASTITSSNLTANRALVSNGSGKVAVSAVTSTELGYLDGVTSNIQTQLDGKAPSVHEHLIGNITNLQGVLDNKLDKQDITIINACYGDAYEIDISEQGIFWTDGLAIINQDGENAVETEIASRVPIVAGDGISLEHQTDSNMVAVGISSDVKEKLDSTYGANTITSLYVANGDTSATAINDTGITCTINEIEIEMNGENYNYCSGQFEVPIVAGDGISIAANSSNKAVIGWTLADRIWAGAGTKSVCIGASSNSATSHSLAVGYNCDAGNYSIVGGYSNNATSSDYALVGGGNNEVSSSYALVGGYKNTVTGSYSLVAGRNNTANEFQTVVGKFSTDSAGPTSYTDTTGDIFKVGKGTGSSALSNAMRVTTAGKVYGNGTFGTTGADYAEYFEWFDGNPNNEDRRGHFVTLEGGKIRYATANDDYILGVVSAEPSVAGDIQSEDWHNMYLKDIYGSKLVEVVEVEETTNEDGEIVPAHTERRWVLNPDYDPDVKYISREERPEWAAIGIVGKLVVIDDGTCQANGYCHPNADGIATASQEKTNYRVMERLDDTHIRIFIR